MHNRIPTAADIQKEFKDFLSKKYGDRVVFPEADANGGKQGQEVEEKPVDIKFDMKPEELEAYLNKYVIKQEEAKEILATKICTHFNRMKLEKDEDEALVGDIKNNIIMIGPTGVGKTYLIRLIANKIGVPFVKGDATKFSETGYVGGDVEDLVRDLVSEAGGNIELAQYGIIYIDEIDKIAAAVSPVGPDVSRMGVQRNLLKLMEETEVDLRAPHDLASQMESVMEFQKTGKVEKKKINTKNILFIVSGAFSGLEEIIRKRLNKQAIGFSASPGGKDESHTETLKQIKSEDLINYGFESEFVGRLPVTVILEDLGVEDLYNILKNPHSSVIVGKKRDFKAYGIEMEFEDKALHKIAEMAYEEKTGARGLVSACEKVLLKFEKKLPSTDIRKFMVTEEVVKDPEEGLRRLLMTESIRHYQDTFYRDYGIRIGFTQEASNLIAEKATKEKTSIDSVCKNMLKDYGHGLKLINREELMVTEEVVENPKAYLDRLIKQFYSGRG